MGRYNAQSIYLDETVLVITTGPEISATLQYLDVSDSEFLLCLSLLPIPSTSHLALPHRVLPGSHSSAITHYTHQRRSSQPRSSFGLARFLLWFIYFFTKAKYKSSDLYANQKAFFPETIYPRSADTIYLRH